MTDSEVQNECRVVCLVRDLLFYSKIRAAAESAGVTLKCLRDPAKLATESGAGLIVDLNQQDALQAATEWLVRSGNPVVGFVSHVDVEAIHAARAAGISQVLARRQLEKSLPGILRMLGDVRG